MNWLVMYGCLYEIIDVGFGALLLAFTSVIQLFLPVPMLGAVIRGKVIPRPLLERLSRRVLRVALLAALAGMALDAWRGWL